MQFHDLKPTKTKKLKKRVGRGGKRGTYSGRGIKGQKARAGRRLKVAGGQTSLLKRTPKLRGFKSRGQKLQTVLFKEISKNFKESEIVSPKTLLAKGLIKKLRAGQIKILGPVSSTKKFIFKGLIMSESVAKSLQPNLTLKK